eukprot:sb/3468838/
MPPQYMNAGSTLQQLRQAQQPRYIQQQVHQQRLNSQYNNSAPSPQQQHSHHQQIRGVAPTPDTLKIDLNQPGKKNISTPEVINIILGSPNTTPLLKKGDKVGDPFSSNRGSTPITSQQVAAPIQQCPNNNNRRSYEREVSEDHWIGVNMPQDLVTPDTAHFSKLVTPGGDRVFEFSTPTTAAPDPSTLFNGGSCSTDPNMFLNTPATQAQQKSGWGVRKRDKKKHEISRYEYPIEYECVRSSAIMG